jgi:hypothetical protein
MSGRKESDIRLKLEKEEKLKSIHKIKDLRKRLIGLSNILKNTLQVTPQGVKTTFEKEVAVALSWIQQAERMKMDELTLDLTQEKLNTELSSLEKQFSNGQSTLITLVTNFTQKADKMEKFLYSDLSRIQYTYAGGQESIKTWFETASASQIEISINKVEALLRQKQLSQASHSLAEIESTINSRIQEARDLEYKHQKRIYVLGALRQVCTEMGFGESEPRFEKPGNRNRIIYEIDTYSQGKIVFFLTLDGISSDSEIVKSHCLDEFDRLSASLEEEFGVETKFRVVGEAPPERGKHKGAKDQPNGTNLELNA